MEPTPSWQIFNLENAMGCPPTVEYVVKSLFVKPSLNVLYGAPGTFKSLILAHLALHIASGKPWLEQEHGGRFTTTRGAVLWVDVDNGRWRTANRLRALARELDITSRLPMYYVSMPEPPFRANEPASIHRLRDLMLEKEITFCVIDNLGLATGGVDENSPLMSVVMSNIRTLAEWTNAALALIHHQRKSGPGGRAGDALRGHSSIEAALDLALHVIRERQSTSCYLRSTKSRDLPFEPLRLEFYYTSAADTLALDTAGFVAYPADTPKTKRSRATDAILESVKRYPQGIAKTRLAADVHNNHERMPGVNVIRGLIDELCEAGELVGAWEGRKFIIRCRHNAPLLLRP